MHAQTIAYITQARGPICDALWILDRLASQLDWEDTNNVEVLRNYMRRPSLTPEYISRRGKLADAVRRSHDRLDQCQRSRTELHRLLLVLQLSPPPEADFPYCSEYPSGIHSTELVINDVAQSLNPQ